jgi:septal ring factor EnvC (AmiA/AmiB activator)
MSVTTIYSDKPATDQAIRLADDSSEIRQQIAHIQASVAELKEKRRQLNEQIKEEIVRLEVHGISAVALKRALKDFECSDDELLELDSAYAVCRTALMRPIQSDLFID